MMPVKKKQPPTRTANTAPVRSQIQTISCYDDSKEVARKVEQWRQTKLAQAQAPQPVTVSPKRRPKGGSERKPGPDCSPPLSAAAKKDQGDPARSESFQKRHKHVLVCVPKGFERLLDKMIREVLLVKPMRLYEFFADLLEAELLRETIDRLQFEKAAKKRKRRLRWTVTFNICLIASVHFKQIFAYGTE
jgi:hypothetical protein